MIGIPLAEAAAEADEEDEAVAAWGIGVARRLMVVCFLYPCSGDGDLEFRVPRGYAGTSVSHANCASEWT